MRPVTEHEMVLIGPWGWIGWMLFVIAISAFGFLWKSSGPTQLRSLNKALADARAVIEDLEARQKDMLRRNQQLDDKHRKLHEEHLELKGQFSQLNVSYGTLDGLVMGLREDLDKERTKRDDQFTELMRARAKNGDL